MLNAVHFLSQLEHQRHPDMQHAPLDGIPSAWRRLVKLSRATEVDRRAYTLCTLERLQDHLRRRDVFVTRSERWGNPRLKLLHGTHWETLRSHVCRALNHHEAPEPALHTLAQALETAYQRTAAPFQTNAAVRIESVKGRDTLTLTGLDKLEEPPSLLKLREAVFARLPQPPGAQAGGRAGRKGAEGRAGAPRPLSRPECSRSRRAPGAGRRSIRS